MENKKVFIGNLDFEVTENELKGLLAKYGTVVSIKMHQKKGYAFAEMGDSAEAAKAIQKLNGVKYKDREMRVSFEMKAGKARSVSVKRYKERGQSISKEKSGNSSDTRSRSEKFRDTLKHKPEDRERNQGSNNKSGGFTAAPGNRHERKERQGIPRPERDRWATERPEESFRSPKKEWSEDKPAQSARPARDENREGYGSYKRSFERSLEKTSVRAERTAGSGNRPLKDYTKEGSGTSRSPRREWTPEKPSYSGKPARNEERAGSPETSRKEWSSDRPSRQSRETNDSWKEKPSKKESSGDKPRDYSKPRPVSSSQNRFSRTSGPKSGTGRSSTGSAGRKPGNSAGRDRNRRSE